MTKEKRKGTLIFLVALLTVVTALFVILNSGTRVANATTVSVPSSTDAISDDNFGFIKGSSITRDCEDMRFTLKLNNPDIAELKGYSRTNNWWGTYIAPTQEQKFTVYRVNADGTTATPIAEYFLWWQENGNSLLHEVGKKQLSYYNESITVTPGELEITGYGYTHLIPADIEYTDTTAKGYKDVKIARVSSTADITGFEVIIKPNSPYSQYYVEYEYSYTKLTWTGVAKDVYETLSGKVHSSVRSICDVLTLMNEAGTLEDEVGDLEYAQSLLNEGSIQTVKVRYLEEIEGTPFAKAVTKTVKVPVLSQGVFIDDVGGVLNKGDFKVFNSAMYEFRYNSSEDLYEGYYLKSRWLRSMTTDGNYVDYFLDINSNYRQSYYKFVEDGVFSEGLYEYVFSKMLNEYPQLAGMKYDEIYGYFGFITIPTTMTFDTLFVEMFDIETSSVGVVKNFSYEDVISAATYNKLLDEYNYGWLEKAWGNTLANVTGNTKATYYMFYSDGAAEAVIGEGGQTDADDTQGAILNNGQAVVVGIWNFGKGIFTDVWGMLTGNGGLNAILVSAVVVGILYVIIKIKFGGVSTAKKSNKKRKK